MKSRTRSLMAKKRKKPLPPRHKRMDRKRRLGSAKQWLPTYEGKNIIKGYKKHYGVDWICAITELELLGVDLDPEYVKQLKITVKNQIIARQRQKESRKLEQEIDNFPYSDETFAFIAGYTSGGTPYGITWEEWEDDPQDLDDEI